jgi:predicted RNase H-like nuclease
VTTTGAAWDRGELVAGVDGCRAGWVVATGTAGTTPELTSIEVVPHIGPVVERARSGEVVALGIDMPIGLPDAGRRACDVAARRRLGPRRSSVFPAPVREVLGSADHAEALRRSRAVDGRGLSVQAFNLLGKITELDSVIGSELADAVLEVHPESSFAVMAGAPLHSTKRTAAGRTERSALLGAHVDSCWPLLAVRRPGSAPDDLADAVAAMWSAWRWVRGMATSLGDGAVDGRGIRMRIVV